MSANEKVPGALPDDVRDVFRMLLEGAANNDLCLMTCTTRATGSPCYVICSMVQNDGGVFSLKPLAMHFVGDPYNEIIPPGTINDTTMRIH